MTGFLDCVVSPAVCSLASSAIVPFSGTSLSGLRYRSRFGSRDVEAEIFRSTAASRATLCSRRTAANRDYTELRDKTKGIPGAEELLNFRIILLLVLATSMGASKVCSQAPVTKTHTPSLMVVPRAGEDQTKERIQVHRFWDKKNDRLFAGVGAARTFDYFSTLNLRRRGGQEILVTNDLVDNHAAFAVLEAAGTGVSIGASYLFHRYGHHKLERWTSIVHFGLATTGAVRNYCLNTASPKTTP